jgi:5-methyltetrahydrofolate--homocysteine methyltransferase
MSRTYERLSTAILEGDADKAPKLVEKGLKEGLGAKDILDNGLVPGMNEVGVRFKAGDMFVPEVLMSADAMQASLVILRPELVASGAKLIGKIVMGTVKGDLPASRSSTWVSTWILRSSSTPSRSTNRTSWACQHCSRRRCELWP